MNRLVRYLWVGGLLGCLALGGRLVLSQEDEEDGPPPLPPSGVAESSDLMPDEPLEEGGPAAESVESVPVIPSPTSVANDPASLLEAAEAAAAFERLHSEGTPQPELTSGLVSTSAPPARATNLVSANPYQAIVARNPFGLRPPPPPAPVPEAQPQVVPSALKLTGVTTLLGGKRAMFVLNEPGKTNVFSDLVREGDWDTLITNLQVLNIDERAGIVKVTFGGREMELDFEKNGIKPPAAPLMAGQPGGAQLPMVRGFDPQRPGQRTTLAPGAGNVNAQPGTTLRQIPSRPSRMEPEVETSTPVLTPQQQIQVLREQEALGREAGVPIPPSPPVPGYQTGGGGDDFGDGPPPLPVPPSPRRR